MMETTATKKHFSKLGLILFLGTLIIYGVQMGALTIAQNIPFIASSGSLSFVITMLPMYVIAFPIIFWMLKRVPAQTDFTPQKMKPLHIIIAFLIAYAAAYICNIMGTIITTIIGVFKQSPVENVVLELTGTINPIVNIFIIVICAPIMEELLFRKFLADRTVKYGEGITIVFSGLVFGLFHGNLAQFTYAFALGIFYAFIYVKTRNIIYTIILHMLQNFMGSFVGLFIIEKSGFLTLSEQLATITDEAQMIQLVMDNIGGLAIFIIYLLFILCLVFTGIILFLVNLKKFKLNPGEVIIEKGQRFKTVLLNLGMILYSLFWIIQIFVQLLK